MSDRDTSYREKVNSTSYTTALENRLYEQSERLEELHMEAAIDAQLTDIVSSEGLNDKPPLNDMDHLAPNL